MAALLRFESVTSLIGARMWHKTCVLVLDYRLIYTLAMPAHHGLGHVQLPCHLSTCASWITRFHSAFAEAAHQPADLIFNLRYREPQHCGLSNDARQRHLYQGMPMTALCVLTAAPVFAHAVAAIRRGPVPAPTARLKHHSLLFALSCWPCCLLLRWYAYSCRISPTGNDF